MNRELKQRRQVVADVLWFMRETPWRHIFLLTFGVKRKTQPEFVRMLQKLGHTPKRAL